MMKASRDRTPVVSSLSCPFVVDDSKPDPEVVLDDVEEEVSEKRVGVVLDVFDKSVNCC